MIRHIGETHSDEEEDDDDDELLKELDEEDDDGMVAAFRERRMQELRAEVLRRREQELSKSGIYETTTDEKSILKITTTTDKCIVHFAHKDFRRCLLMDKHLAELARRHPQTRFLKIDVENAPFLVEKLKIKVLPCLMAFVDGIAVDKLLGFEGVAEKDDFATSALEKRLSEGSKVIELALPKPERSSIFGFANNSKVSDEDD
eukprot:jgi/Hompol1/620/HPOL_005366-RA